MGGDRHHHKDMNDETASLLSESGAEDEERVVSAPVPRKEAPPFMNAFTFQSSMNIIYYAFLALHSITFDQLLPVLLSYPPEDPAGWTSPLRFAGGFGLSSAQVGKIFSMYGMVGMTMQVGAQSLLSTTRARVADAV